MKNFPLVNLLCCLLFFIFSNLAGQYTVPYSGADSITTCSGTVSDHAGNSSYSNNANGTLTIKPAVNGNYVKLVFTSFETYSSFDYLYIYDGENSNAPLIGTYYSYTSPGTVYATNSTGKLTLRFITSGSYVASGFDATIECVSSIPKCDLTLSSPLLGNSTIVAGNTLSVYSYVNNQGTNKASAQTLGYFLSKDNIYQPGDILIGISNVSSINAGSSSYTSAYLTIPSNAVGDYYVIFYADYLNQIPEDNENNNSTTLALKVSASNIDLSIINPIVTPSSIIAAGGSVTISSTIINLGTTSAPSSTIGYYLSTDNIFDSTDVSLGSSIGGALAGPGLSSKSATISIPTGTTIGAYYILVIADPLKNVYETNESNNVSSISITIANPFIDLIATPLTISSTSIPAGTPVSVTANVTNQGNFQALSSNLGYYLSTDSIFSVSDVYLTYSSGGTLSNGSSSSKSATVTIPSNTAIGSYYLLFFADYQNQTLESIETNNVKFYAISVVSAVTDLSISTASLSSSSTAAGNSITVYSTTKNNGNTSISYTYTGYYLSTDSIWSSSDTYLTYTYISSLNGGSTYPGSSTLTIPSSTASGNYYIICFADYSGYITENTESNNYFKVPISIVAPTYDLYLSSLYSSSSTVFAGSSVSVSCNIHNKGNATSASSSVGYYLSTDTIYDNNDVYLDYTYGGSLSAGANSYRSDYLVILSNTAPGNYYLIFVADYNLSVSETNESNNSGYKSIIVSAPSIDLYMSSCYLGTSSTSAGSSVSVDGYINNGGNSSASSSNVGYYLSTNSTWDVSDVFLDYTYGSSLAGGSSSSKFDYITIPSSTSSGDYYIIFYADYSGSVSETNETNNTSAQPITIYAYSVLANLIPFGFTLSSSSVDAGSSVDASCFIYNIGSSTASSSNLGYYLSSNNTWDANDTYLDYSYGGSLSSYDGSEKFASLTIPSAAVSGNYYILFFADYNKGVTEGDETDNVEALPITIVGANTTDIKIPLTGNNSVTTCTGTVTDNGGTSNYSNNANGVLTLFSGSAVQRVKLDFVSFNIESCCDYLAIYDGESVNSNLIGVYTSNPGSITGTHFSGALTLKFVSDDATTASGFLANISCETKSGVSENTVQENTLHVFPNPVSDLLNINLSSSADQQKIEILSVSGQVLYTQDITSFSTSDIISINMGNFSNGIYTLRITAGNQITNNKIIKVQ